MSLEKSQKIVKVLGILSIIAAVLGIIAAIGMFGLAGLGAASLDPAAIDAYIKKRNRRILTMYKVMNKFEEEDAQ